MNSKKFNSGLKTKRWDKIKKSLVFGIVVLFFASGFFVFENEEVKGESGYVSHEPIYINGNENFTVGNGVKSGNGTKENPFVIEGWDINASSDNGIEIENADKYFVIRNSYVHDGFSDYENGGNDNIGIRFENVKNGTIENSEINNNRHGIYIDNSTTNIINKNNIYSNTGYGISLVYSSNSTINNNTIYSNTVSGIFVLYSHQNIITNNTIYSNNERGIFLFNVSYSIITNNTIYSNYWHGVYLQFSSYNNINNNNIRSNYKYGLYLYYSTNNDITKNNVSNNEYGIYFYSSSKNKIYLNSFINNTNQTHDKGNNYWDYNYTGNYWSDYNGEDKNKDGIGDTPYLISDGNNKDNYPLMISNSNPKFQKSPENQNPPFPFFYIPITIIIIFIILISLYFLKKPKK